MITARLRRAVRLNAEAETHANGGVGAVADGTTRSVDIVEGVAGVDMRRTQPPVVCSTLAVIQLFNTRRIIRKVIDCCITFA